MVEIKHKTCPQCGAEMQIEEEVMTSPPLYRYHCPNCGRLEFDTERYPQTSITPLPAAIPPPCAPFDWQAFRAETAKSAMLGILANWGHGFAGRSDEIPTKAIEFADELIKQLKKNG